jgi:hypothetical protein
MIALKGSSFGTGNYQGIERFDRAGDKPVGF